MHILQEMGEYISRTEGASFKEGWCKVVKSFDTFGFAALSKPAPRLLNKAGGFVYDVQRWEANFRHYRHARAIPEM